MRALSAVGLVALAACSHDRVMLVLDGSAPGATEIEIVMAEPFVVKRPQRAYESQEASGIEDTFYIAQRSAVRYPLAANQQIAGTRLQIELPTREPFVPIAVARDASGTIVGMGAYLADKLYADGAVPAADFLADVTVHELTIEPIAPATDDVGVPPGSVVVAKCGDRVSGLAWRRGNPDDPERKPQLRVVLPFDDPAGSALDRLDTGSDLDCDGSTPGQGGLVARTPGDQRDCDDLDDAVGPDAPEVCNGRDDNCDSMLPPLAPDDTGMCPTPGPGCPALAFCDERSGGKVCASAQLGCNGNLVCDLPFRLATGSNEGVACSNATGIFSPGIDNGNNACTNGCTVTLVAVPPEWEILIDSGPVGGPVTPMSGLFQSVEVEPGADELLYVTATSSTLHTIGQPAARFTLYVQPKPMPSSGILVTFDLVLKTETDQCGMALEYTCGIRQ